MNPGHYSIYGNIKFEINEYHYHLSRNFTYTNTKNPSNQARRKESKGIWTQGLHNRKDKTKYLDLIKHTFPIDRNAFI